MPPDPLQSSIHTHSGWPEAHGEASASLSSFHFFIHVIHSLHPSLHPYLSSTHVILYSFTHPDIIHAFPLLTPPVHSCTFSLPHHVFTHFFKFPSFAPSIHSFRYFPYSHRPFSHTFSYSLHLWLIHPNPSLIHNIYPLITIPLFTPSTPSINPFFCSHHPSVHLALIHTTHLLIHFNSNSYSLHPFIHVSFIHTIHVSKPFSRSHHHSLMPFFYSSIHTIPVQSFSPSFAPWAFTWALCLILFCSSVPLALPSMANTTRTFARPCPQQFYL